MNGESSKKVLVAEGDDRDRALLKEAVGGESRCVVCAKGGEAYNRMRRERFDVVISDADLADIDGLSFLDLARGLGHRPPFILVSAGATVDWTRDAFKHGAFDVIPKPLDLGEVRRVVRLASQGPEMASVVSSNIDAPNPLSDEPVFRSALERLRSQCRRDNARVCLIVLDIDGVDNSNQDESRGAGDEIVRRLMRGFERMSHATPLVARLGALRSMIAIRNLDEDRAAAAVKQFRCEIDKVVSQAGTGAKPHYRFGIAASEPGFIESVDDLIERAHAAAARAEELGGHQIVCWSHLGESGPSRRLLEAATPEQVSGWISRTRQQAKRGYVESTMALVAAVEAKEPLTREHARVVSRYCEEIAKRMDLPAAQVESIKTAALLHDIGKIGVPDAILRKPGPLTRDEFEVVKRHPQTAIDILGHASYLQSELPVILHHHERFDGGGYPAGLKGTDIPLGARILCVGDALDAMLSMRSYKHGFTLDQVEYELTDCAGKQFDDEIARVALEWLDHDPDAVRGECGQFEVGIAVGGHSER